MEIRDLCCHFSQRILPWAPPNLATVRAAQGVVEVLEDILEAMGPIINCSTMVTLRHSYGHCC